MPRVFNAGYMPGGHIVCEGRRHTDIFPVALLGNKRFERSIIVFCAMLCVSVAILEFGLLVIHISYSNNRRHAHQSFTSMKSGTGIEGGGGLKKCYFC